MTYTMYCEDCRQPCQYCTCGDTRYDDESTDTYNYYPGPNFK